MAATYGFRLPAAAADRGAMSGSGCLGLLILGDSAQNLGLGEIGSSKIVGAIRAPMCRGKLGGCGAQVANRGLYSSHGPGTGVVDDPGLLGLPGRISHSRSSNDLQFVVGSIGDALQIAVEIFCERGIFGANRR